MTDKEFYDAIIAANEKDDTREVVKLCAWRTQYFIDRMQITHFTDIDIPCIIAAAMITEKSYCANFPEAVGRAKELIKGFGVTAVKIEKGEIKNG